MEKIIPTIILFSLLSCLTVPEKSDKNQADPTYMSKYSGGYMVEVDGQSSENEVEVYALNENGGASWLWVENQGKGNATVDDKKTGIWKAWKDTISIDIQGNSGLINETFVLEDGKFREISLSKRWLKRTED